MGSERLGACGGGRKGERFYWREVVEESMEKTLDMDYIEIG